VYIYVHVERTRKRERERKSEREKARKRERSGEREGNRKGKKWLIIELVCHLRAVLNKFGHVFTLVKHAEMLSIF